MNLSMRANQLAQIYRSEQRADGNVLYETVTRCACRHRLVAFSLLLVTKPILIEICHLPVLHCLYFLVQQNRPPKQRKIFSWLDNILVQGSPMLHQVWNCPRRAWLTRRRYMYVNLVPRIYKSMTSASEIWFRKSWMLYLYPCPYPFLFVVSKAVQTATF